MSSSMAFKNEPVDQYSFKNIQLIGKGAFGMVYLV